YAKFIVDRKNTSGMAYFSILCDNISEMSMAKNQLSEIWTRLKESEDPSPSTGHYEKAPPSTKGELLSATTETVPCCFPKHASSTLALFLEFVILNGGSLYES
ncbi:hypothetical protein HAX54_044277, partial [Datura stramonium]|nr:hypothetical protein [Datura stramonium]